MEDLWRNDTLRAYFVIQQHILAALIVKRGIWLITLHEK